MKTAVFTLRELLELTAVSQRSFYSYRYPPWRLVSDPIRVGRNFRYDRRHVTQLLMIRSYLLMDEPLKNLWKDKVFLKTRPEDEHARRQALQAERVGAKNPKLHK